MSNKSSNNFKKIVTFSLMTFCLAIPCQVTFAASRRPKVKTVEPAPVISEAFYDKTWRTYQVGSKKEKAEAMKELKAIVKKAPEEFMAHYYLGIMNAEEGSPNPALKHFETALLGFPNSADIHARMGELLDSKNKTEDAVDHFEKALKIDPANAKALARIGLFELENGNLDNAFDLLTRARKVQPDNPETLRGLGSVLINRNSAKEALPILEQALLFDEKHAENHWLLAKAYEKLEQPDKAALHYEQARKLGRKDGEIKEMIGYDLARSLLRSGKNQEAEAEYKKEIRKNQDPATGLVELAQLYADTGREDDAIKLYLKAYSINSDFGEGVMQAAEIYLKREDYKNAEAILTLLKNDADFKERARIELRELEEMKLKQENLKLQANLEVSNVTDADTEATYFEMLNLNKNDPQALEGLMNFFQERGYYDQALHWFKKYNKVCPTTDQNRKAIEKDLKNRLELDNFTLFGFKLKTNLKVYSLERGKNKRVTKEVLSSKSADVPDDTMANIAFMALPFKDSVAADDQLINMAFNGDHDRLKEVSFYILLTREEYKKDRKINEGLLEFYEERGRTEEALKCVATMRRLGFYTTSEAAEKRDKLRGK